MATAPPAPAGDDREALTRAVESYRTYLLSVAERLGDGVPGRFTRSDVVQEALLSAVATIRDGRPPGRGEGELKAWLRQILKRTYFDLIRFHAAGARDPGREAGGGVDDLTAGTTSPGGKAVRNEEFERLDRALAALDDRDRRLLSWRHDDGLTFEEIGRRLGCTHAGASKAYRKAAGRLLALYGGAVADGDREDARP